MIAQYRKETRQVSVGALVLLALFGVVVLTDAAPRSPDPVEGQPRAGDYQFIFTGDATDGKGSAKGILGCVVTGSGIHWKEGASYTNGTPGIPMGSVAMDHLRHPPLLVKLPVVPGSEWKDQWPGYRSVTRVLLDPAPLALAAGTFSDCIVIETEVSEAETADPDHNRFVINSTCGTRTIWLARGVGIIRMIYAHSDGTSTEMSLTDYTMGGETREYFPTVHNAKWSYLFKSDAFPEGVKEEWVLSSRQEVGYRSFEDLFPTPQGGHIFPNKETGETEGAYQVRIRRYVRLYEEAQAEMPKRSGESQAGYEARVRARVRNELMAETTPPPTIVVTIAKRPGESEAAYQARLRAAARNRILTRTGSASGVSTPGSKLNSKKRRGESEAAYQARLRAAARNFKLTEVILTENGAGGHFKTFSTARKADGEHLARACFQFESSEDLFRLIFQGSKGAAPEPSHYPTVWSYLSGSHESIFHFSTVLGTAWKQPGLAISEAMSSIAGLEGVTVESGTYDGCLKIVTGISGVWHASGEFNRFINGVRTLWFAPGVGLVKMVYASENGKRTEAELVDFTVGEPTASYMPLALGNEWTYRWTTGYRDYDVIETLRIAAPGEHVYMFVRGHQNSGPDWELIE